MPKRAVAIFCLGLVTACAGSTTIGNPSPLPTASLPRLGEPSNTTTPGARPTGSTEPSRTQSARPTEVRVSMTIAITEEGFDPTLVSVVRDSFIKVVNRDSQARSLRTAQGQAWSYDTGLIAPGRSIIFQATTSGTFTLEDGTRPYVFGRLQIG